MPKMVKCSFCGNDVEVGSGLMYVRNDGNIMWFCSSKCLKNFRLGREPRKLPWTSKYVATK